MKKLRWSGKAVLLPLVLLIFSSCATTQVAETPRFHEGSGANVVLRFARWDYISITQPEYRDGQFLRQLQRDQLGQAFNDLHLRRDLAVVVVGWTYQDEVLEKLVGEWRTVLKTHGFQRIVCLRGGGAGNIDGLQVLDDSNTSVGHAKQTAGL